MSCQSASQSATTSLLSFAETLSEEGVGTVHTVLGDTDCDCHQWPCIVSGPQGQFQMFVFCVAHLACACVSFKHLLTD